MAGVRIVRLFVSSLGELEPERQRLISVAERLNDAFSGSVRFETETSDTSLQPDLSDAGEEFDIAIGIVEAQPGSELPAALPRASDVVLFQKQPPSRRAGEPADLDLQSKLLKGLIEHGLHAREGQFRAGFHNFDAVDEFERQVDKLLRDWIAINVAMPPAPAALVAGKPRRWIAVAATLTALIFAAAAVAAGHRLLQTQRELDRAHSTVAELAEASTETVRPHAQLDSVESLLALTRDAVRKLAAWSDDADILRRRARASLLLAEIDLERGHIEESLKNAAAALETVEPLATAGNLEARHLRAQAERLIGTADWELTRNVEAHRHFERGIAELGDLLKRGVDPKISWRWMHSLAELHQSMGEVLLLRFDKPREALEAFDRSRELRLLLLQLGHTGPAFQRDLAWITSRRGDVEYRLANDEAAAALYAEARDRLDALRDGIWENLKWAAELGVINNNIGLIKRRQKRFSEADAIFAQAEQLLTTVHNRDPKNLNRALVLNWNRYLRAENLFRWALSSNDRIRLVAVRDQVKSIIEFNGKIAALGAPRRQALHNAARENALMSAIDATLRQLNGNFEGAAAGYSEAADAITKTYLPDAKKMPWPDLLRENIEYLEWAGIAYAKAQKAPEAELLFKRALAMLAEYRSILEPTIFDEFQKRIEARL